MVEEDDIAFLFIGGAHQVYHLAPVAAELSRKLPANRIVCLYPDEETGVALQQVKDTLDAPAMRLLHVPPPRWAERLANALHYRSIRKIPLLLRLAWGLRKAKAIVTPERTSATLRWMGVRAPMIHFRHGAGDRAPSSEKRLRAFDLVVVPGEKDVQRAVNVQHLPPARVRRGGYVKLDYLDKRGTPAIPLFNNDRPVVVYNPHFDLAISSWPVARQVIEAFRAQDRYNLVVAPHIRLSDNMGEEEALEWLALGEPGRIIVDLRSPRLLDMSYTMAADIYLGDMSSQLYEFLVHPRPVAFLNIHDAAWQDDPRYAGWRLGEVTDRVEDVLGAIDRARANHPSMIDRQRAAVAAAYGNYRGASRFGAEIVAEALAA